MNGRLTEPAVLFSARTTAFRRGVPFRQRLD
jgi:hypothetical protein